MSQFPDLGSEITRDIIKAAIEVHRHLGPGLLESVYEACLVYELERAGLQVEHQKKLPVFYKGIEVGDGFRIDVWVNRKVVVELKATEKILPIHEAQLLTYMKLSDTPLGLILNFNETLLKNGIKRMALSKDAKTVE
ncbi:MAG: GxxExxY protein [Alphaproteobacteria bacterium]|nr:GxxExxY protein [Alphaproteobacteria bacterium]